MELSENQLRLKDHLEQVFNEQLEQFDATPSELKAILAASWSKLDNVDDVDYDANAILATIKTLIHLRELSQEFQPEDLATLIDLLIAQSLVTLQP